MKAAIIISVVFLSLTSQAWRDYDSAFCRAIFVNDDRPDAIYIEEMTMNEESEITLDRFATKLARQQTFAVYMHLSNKKISSFSDVLKYFDGAQVIQQSFEHASTHARYTRIVGYVGDTEESAIFFEGDVVPTAYTSDGVCYQERGLVF